GARGAAAAGNLDFATANRLGVGFSPGGPASLGGGGGGLGYAGIGQSVAITMRAYDHSSTELAVNGSFPGPQNNLSGTGIDFNAAAQASPRHTFQVTLSYSGTTLTETITDLTTSATVTETYNNVNIPATVGGNTAWVG